MNSKILLIIVLIILAGGLVLTLNGTDNQEFDSSTETTNNASTENEGTMDEEITVNEAQDNTEDMEMSDESETTSTEEAGSQKMSSGSYETYTESKLAMADTGNVVLFFKADWCPSCRALDADITANADAIPSDLTILEINYDTATELRKKYGVTTQHTLVEVDSDGELIKKWTGTPTLASLVTQL